MASGEQRSCADLRGLVKQTRAIRAILDTLPSRYPKFIIEQTAIAGALTPDIMSKPELAEQNKSIWPPQPHARRGGRGWGCTSGDGGLVFTRELRGVSESVKIDGPLIASADARRLDMAGALQAVYLDPASLTIKDQTITVGTPLQLLDTVLEHGQQGISLQRYRVWAR